MATFRCTAFFQFNGKGWTESYYTNASIIDDAVAQFRILMTARCKLSPPEVIVKALRISDVARPRFSVRDTPTGTYGAGTYTPVSGTAHVNFIEDAIIVELTATPLHKNRIFLRGLPDTIFESDSFVGDAAWSLNFGPGTGSYRNEIITNWRCRNKATLPAVGFVYDPITDVSTLQITTRKSGRPFGLRVGRRRTRRSA